MQAAVLVVVASLSAVHGAAVQLVKRQGAAAGASVDQAADDCSFAPLEEYNLGLHVGAIFILLVASMLGVVIPYVGNWIGRFCSDGASSRLRSMSNSLTFAMRHFGGGIILSTAFIHLLFEAFVTFANPCIQPLAFDATSPAVAMATVYLLFIFDFLLLRSKRRDAFYPSASSSSSLNGDEGELSKTVVAQDTLARCNVFAIESGIIFHSVIIGITIGTSSGDGWIVRGSQWQGRGELLTDHCSTGPPSRHHLPPVLRGHWDGEPDCDAEQDGGGHAADLSHVHRLLSHHARRHCNRRGDPAVIVSVCRTREDNGTAPLTPATPATATTATASSPLARSTASLPAFSSTRPLSRFSSLTLSTTRTC